MPRKLLCQSLAWIAGWFLLRKHLATRLFAPRSRVSQRNCVREITHSTEFLGFRDGD